MFAPLRLLLSLFVAAFLCSGVYITQLIWEREASLSEAARYSLQWTASQAVTEVLRLETAIATAAMTRDPAAIQDVQLRYSIISGRMKVLREGEFAHFLSREPRSAEAVSSAEKTLAALEPQLAKSTDPKVAQDALAKLRPLSRHFVNVAATAFRHNGEVVVAEQAEVSRLHWLLSWLMLGLLACGLGLIAFLVWNNHLVRQANERLGRATKELKAANQAALAASNAKSLFLANMSHEIRTPMNGVLGMIELLLRSPLADEQRARAMTIARSARSLLNIINDVLDFSRIEARALTLNARPFDPRCAIRDAVALLSETARDKGLALNLTIADDFPASLHGDETRVRQILTNLVGNAIKFTSKGSIAIDVTATPAAGRIREIGIVVRDTGIGISPDVQPRLFRPFEQADASINRRFGGTGLGLSIAREIAQAMNGSIALASEVGIGTTVTVNLQLLQGDALPSQSSTVHAEHEPTAKALPRALRVLVAEDNPVNVEVALGCLASLTPKCIVTVARNGREAMDALSRDAFDIVLMDCQMPEMDGFTAVRLIRENEHASGAKQRMPVLAVTASAYEEDRVACLAAGFDDVVSKPYTFDQLSTQIARLTAGSAAATAAKPDASEASAEHNDIATLDRSKLDQIWQLLPGRADTLVGVFLEHLPQQIARMQRALHDGDAKGISEIAHSLKSSAATLGAARFAAHCRQLERHLKIGDADALAGSAALVSQVAAEAKRATEALTQVRAERAAPKAEAPEAKPPQAKGTADRAVA